MNTSFCFLMNLVLIAGIGCFPVYGQHTSTTAANYLNKTEKPVIFIKIKNKEIKSGDKILISVIYRNTTSKSQKIIITGPDDKPWGLSAKLADFPAQNILPLKSMAFTFSKAYSTLELKNNYMEIKPGEIVSKVFELNDILSVNNSLPKGKYTLQLSYFNNQSNKIVFEVL